MNFPRAGRYISATRMSSIISIGPGAKLSESQQAALVTLLADEDPVVYQMIRAKILSLGEVACGWLRAHSLSSDPIVRRRVLEVIRHLERQSADNRFLGFCVSQGEDLELEKGIWLLAQTQYPEINTSAYEALLDSFAGDLRERIDFGAGVEGILASINHYLFTEMRFGGNEDNYYDPENSYLNRVIDRRTGNPISLCLVYLFVARRLRLPVTGIGMPGHFLTRFQSSTGELFIDAFNRGKLLTKADCVKYLLHTSHGFQETYLSPMSSRRILLRVCSNLHQIYSQLTLAEETSRLQRYIVALAKG